MTGSIPFAIKRNETTAFTRGLLDDVDAAAAKTTLDLGNAASLDVGTTAGTVAAGDDSRFGGSGDALVANPLSQFAATTSAQLAGVISDETGTGALVFANTPTLISPAIGAATGTSLVLSGNLTGAAATFSGLVQVNQATANTGIIASTGYSLTGSNATSLANFSGTWNTSGTPTLLHANVTNTASGTGSKLIDLQANSVSQFAVQNDIAILGVGPVWGVVTRGVILGTWYGNAVIAMGPGSNNAMVIFGNGGTQLYLGNDVSISPNTNLFEQRSGTNGQRFGVLQSHSSPTNKTGLLIDAQTAGAIRLGPGVGTAGGTPLTLALGSHNGTTWTDWLSFTTAGAATLSGLLKFTGYTTALLPVATANEGAITYDTTLDKHVGSNGTTWNVLW